MFRAPATHWFIAAVLSAPGAIILALCIPFTVGANPSPAWFPATFLPIWIVSTAFALTGDSPKSVFRRTCCTYALSVFLVPFISLGWPELEAGQEGYGFWLGLTRYPAFVTILLFFYGGSTGAVALFLGFGKLTRRIPQFDYSRHDRKTPSDMK